MTTRRRFLLSSVALASTGALARGSVRAAATPRFTSDPFTLGVASGYPSSSSVVLWTRLAPTPLAPAGGMSPEVVPVEWELALDDQMRRVVRRDMAYAAPEWAHSIHVEPEGLDPGREYWYRFTAGEARSPGGGAHTAPPPGASLERLKVALVCCQHYEQGYYAAYRHIVADEPDLILHVGDYIYETNSHLRVRSHDLPVAVTLDDYRARHALYRTDADLAAAHAAHPWLLVWDDHDVANDYAGDVSEENDDPKRFLARRAAAYRAYYEHMPMPRWAVPVGPDMRMYGQRSYGDLASIVLIDQRQYRSPEACPPPGRAGGHRVNERECPELDRPDRTILGARQEEWAFATLADSHARWNLLAQGTLMGHLNEVPLPDHRYWTDAWNGYPAARDRLIGFLAERHVANPVVLSGDIHAFVVSGLHRKATDLDSPVVAPEFVTTSVSSDALAEEYFDNARKLNPNLQVATGLHRGYVRLDVQRDRLRADLIALDTVKHPNCAARTLSSFVVENGQPTPVKA